MADALATAQPHIIEWRNANVPVCSSLGGRVLRLFLPRGLLETRLGRLEKGEVREWYVLSVLAGHRYRRSTSHAPVGACLVAGVRILH